MSAKRVARSTVPEAAAQLLAQHDVCLQVVARVEACLDRRPEASGPWLRDLREALSDLYRTLGSHFAEEERGPLYRVLPVARPRFAHRLERLRSEHERISASIASAIARAAALDDPQLYDLRALDAQVQLVVADIRRHEAAEDEVLFTANWDEIGVGD